MSDLKGGFTPGSDESGRIRYRRGSAMFHETIAGCLPRTWRQARLEEVALKITDGTHESVVTVDYESDTVPFLYVSCVGDNGIKWNRAARISLGRYTLISRGRIPAAGMILYTAVGSYGHAALIEEARDFAFQRHIACIYPNTSMVDAAFVAIWLNGSFAKHYADTVAIGNAQKTVTLRSLARFPVPIPPKWEQRRIAETLGVTDQAIRSTARLITKLEQAKQGLLGDIFDESHHAINDSTQWKYVPLGTLVDHLIDYRGRTPRKLGMSWGSGNILALSANNVQMGRVDPYREAYYGSERLYHAWMTHGPTRRGDVLITLEAPLGNIAQIPDDKKYILSQRVVLLSFAERRILNDYAYWYMRTDTFQRALVASSTGTTATGIRRAHLERIMMPVPEVKAQRRIAQDAFAIQSKIDSELAVEAKLRQTRRGLVDDLLTGRVRVGASV